MKKIFLLLSFSVFLFGIGGPSGPKMTYQTQGQLGEVVVNPYGTAPLTAIIKDGGYTITNASVSIEPKKDGVEIAYTLKESELKTHGGIAIFGLYADYLNTVSVSYTKHFGGKQEHVKESYKIYAAPLFAQTYGARNGVFFSQINVKKVAPKFKNRLYLINNIGGDAKGVKAVWNNPAGGALEWAYEPEVFVIDTQGEVRWFLLPNQIYDMDSLYKSGVMMGFRQDSSGLVNFGYGQRQARIDIMGRSVLNRRLPLSYNDFSHSLFVSGDHVFLRVGSANYKRPDGKNVRTVRDVIVELDANGRVFDEWRLFEILDPYRSVVLKVLNKGAVCLNVDAKLEGLTMSTDELARLETSDEFGDIIGTGAGRNWAHVNSVVYDKNDDSIIVSSRHQSAIVKIGRDKKVKWILGSPEGWGEKFKKALLKPVDASGNEVKCIANGSQCPGFLEKGGGFDWTWTQHTAFKIEEKSSGDIVYITAFDNGDARGMRQPNFANEKYSRAVIYKIDQKKMSVEQIWEYGKERGNAWFSPVTSITEFVPQSNSVVVYSATAGMGFDIKSGKPSGSSSPVLLEFEWDEGAKAPKSEPSVEIEIKDAMGYQAMPFFVFGF